MVAARYGGSVVKHKAFTNYIQLYYPQLVGQPNAEELAAKAWFKGEGPSLQAIHDLFQGVADRLAVAPCSHLQTLFNGFSNK